VAVSKSILLYFIFFYTLLYGECTIQDSLKSIIQKTSISQLTQNHDVMRQRNRLKNLCLYKVRFLEASYQWEMLLVTHPKNPQGAFWFLPHDDENTAFDAAVYATEKYGGGFLSISAKDKRYYQQQDPNRNFGDTTETAQICPKQKYPAPLYSKIIFKIIDTFKKPSYPYLSLHNNKDGYHANGGQGSVSILTQSSSVLSYPAHKNIDTSTQGLKDEDSLIYIAGFTKRPERKKLSKLLSNGLNTSYEIIHKNQNDCSLSNYVVLRKKTLDYYNIETEHGDLKTQKNMIDKLMKLLK
jgi:hypothetical protein